MTRLPDTTLLELREVGQTCVVQWVTAREMIEVNADDEHTRAAVESLLDGSAKVCEVGYQVMSTLRVVGEDDEPESMPYLSEDARDVMGLADEPCPFDLVRAPTW